MPWWRPTDRTRPIGGARPLESGAALPKLLTIFFAHPGEVNGIHFK